MKLDLATLIAAFSAEHPEASRAIFNQAREASTDRDERALLELAREYHCDPEFKKAMTDYTFALTYRKPAAR